MVDVWQAMARAPGRRMATFYELAPIVCAALWATEQTTAAADLSENLFEVDPDKVLAYVGTALVQVEFARMGWNPPPAMIWTVN